MLAVYTPSLETEIPNCPTNPPSQERQDSPRHIDMPDVLEVGRIKPVPEPRLNDVTTAPYQLDPGLREKVVPLERQRLTFGQDTVHVY